MSLAWHWLGQVAYARALALQHAWRDHVQAGRGAGAVLLCEHPPTITLGRSATLDHVLMAPEARQARGIALAQTDRGGQVTYHGPGQLMIYTVVALPCAIPRFLASVAGAIGGAVAGVGGPSLTWQREPAGLWLEGKKVAACGIHVARGVTTHGFALNWATPAEVWDAIVPCGARVPQLACVDALRAQGQKVPAWWSLVAAVGQGVVHAVHELTVEAREDVAR